LLDGEDDPGIWTRYEYTFDTEGNILLNIKETEVSADFPIYMARMDSVGYDATGRETGVEETVDLITDFHKLIRW